jgi:peptide chain release factor 3
MSPTPFQYIRWITSECDVKTLDLASDTKVVADFKENKLLLFRSEWSITWALEHNKGLDLQEFGNAE